MDYSQISSIPFSIVGGIFWTITYILIIKKGFQDRSYGVPLVALAFNFSWEIIFSFIYPHTVPQLYVNIVWLLFDCVIAFQFLAYGKSKNEYNIPRKWFYVTSLSLFILAFLHTLTMTLEFSDFSGKYSAFTMNLTMSILYVVLYFRRRSLRGQSIYIAAFKMLGTVNFSLLFFLRSPTSPFMNFLYFSILLFDIYYVILLLRHKKMIAKSHRAAEIRI